MSGQHFLGEEYLSIPLRNATNGREVNKGARVVKEYENSVRNFTYDNFLLVCHLCMN